MTAALRDNRARLEDLPHAEDARQPDRTAELVLRDERLALLARMLGVFWAIGLSIGVAVWQLRLGASLESYIGTNGLSRSMMPSLWGTFAPSFAVVGAVVGLVAALGRRSGDVLARLGLLARRASPLVLAALLPPLLCWQAWPKDHDRSLGFLLLATIFVLGLQALLRFALSDPRGDTIEPGAGRASWTRYAARFADLLPRWLPLAVVALAAAGYASFFAYHTIVHHRNYLSTSLDLGLEENLVWNVLHGGRPLFKSSPHAGPTCTHLGNHATWFAFVVAAFYAIRQNAETMLLFQAIVIGAAAIPLYLVARRHLPAWLSCFVALLYLLYPPVHGANLYDFHYPPLGPFFIWFTLYWLERRSWLLAILFGALTLSIREDISAALIVLGGYLLLADRRPRAGLVTAMAGMIYFPIMKLVVMPRAAGGSQAFVGDLYGGLLPPGDHAQSYPAVLRTVFSNLAFTVDSTIVNRDKLIYLLLLLLPLAFFPLRRPIGLLCAVPGFFFTLLSTGYRPLYEISFQYTAHWTAYLFLAVILNLAWLYRAERERGDVRARVSRHAWVGALAGGMLVMSHQFGAVLQQNTVRGGFGTYHFGTTAEDARRRADGDYLVAMVPPRAKIAAAENLVPHLSNRPDAYTLRVSLFDADYLMFSVNCWGDERPKVAEALRPGTFGVLATRGEFVLARRGAPTDGNAGLLARLGM